MATPALTNEGAAAAAATSDAAVRLAGEERAEALTLLASVFLVAACSLIYELLIATVSSYLLGSSVTQFSLCIGVFIGAMGIGSYLSQFVRRDLLRIFFVTEIALGIVGGLSAWLLFGAYALGLWYYAALFGVLILIGGLSGLELPLLTRLLNEYGALRTIIAQALSFDYVGALLGSVAFPLLLLPALGTARTAFLIGLLNVGVAAWNIWVFRRKLRAFGPPLTACGIVIVAMLIGLVFAERASSFLEQRLYEDEVIYSRQTPYQKIVLTRWKNDLRLYLDGNLQFSSVDEYRYHESLVHPVLSLARSREEVLMLGGGDGLALREVLKYPDVKRITLVDIDAKMTDLGRRLPAIAELNHGSFDDKRVRVVHEDAYKFLEQGVERYGVIIADLPDPNNEALAKLYSREFYRLAQKRLAAGGVFVTQATSPFFARDAFWCIEKSLHEAGWRTTPYHAYVPSFGDWGFILAAPDRKPSLSSVRLTLPMRFLTAASLPALAVFDADIAPSPVSSSTLDAPAILKYYEKEAGRWQ